LLVSARLGIDFADRGGQTHRRVVRKSSAGRGVAATYLGCGPDGYTILLVEWAPADRNQYVRPEAARALGQRGGEASIPNLNFALEDLHNVVRDMAAA
jgi:HEAT repeat protein